jgi:hypothetical protein
VLKLLLPKKIKENWKTYKEHLIIASEATEGGDLFTDGGSEEYLKGIYGRLMNPFNRSMHLWIENDDDYLLLTHIQTCEFTERKTLVIFSLTRTKDVDNSTILQRWFDGYPVIKKFAKENECVGIIGYSDLEYFTKIVKEVAKSTKQEIIIRYQYYVPL